MGQNSKSAGKYRKIRSTVELKPKTKGQEEYIELIRTNDLTICDGPAGSGKTLVGVGMAIKLYKESNGFYNRIVIARPAVVACDEDLGFLPGDLDDKMKPYMLPIMDSLKTFLDESEILELFNLGVIEVVPIAYMRGRTFNKAICILDEAQNATAKQMKMFLTRLGFQTKAIVEGDSTQCDLNGPDRVNNGLVDAMDRLEDVEGIGVIELTPIDIVRSELCNKIIDAYGD